MKFIESFELREWVKDNLRKTIFQKAHALSVQTGCEILVKMHDNQDISGCQYYATSNLKQIYRNSKLRQPGEMQVSGETGLPLMDKCIQYGEDASASTESSIPNDVGGGGDGGMQSEFQGQTMGGEESAVPMQLSSAGFSDFNSQTQQQSQGEDDGGNDSDIEITQITNPQNLMTNVQVKQEPSMFEQQNTMYGQQQQQQQGMMGSQGMLGNEGMQQPAYQVPISPKPYQCSICRKAFKSVHVLQKHTLTFHTPGSGAGGHRSRGRGNRGNRGGRGRGRGRGLKLTISRTQSGGGQQQQYQAMPTVKTEAGATTTTDPNSDPNSTTCTYCNQTFEQHEQLSAHIPECPVAQQQQQQQQQPDQFDPNSETAGSLDQSGFPTDFPSASQDDPSSGDTSWQQQFMPPDGSSPSGLNLPSASSFFGQQNPPTSMYNTPTQSPRASSSGAGSSGGSRKTKRRGSGRTGGPLAQHSDMSKHSIMAAILQTAGKVVKHKMLVSNWMFLSMLTAKQFLTAATALEEIGLGSVIAISTGGRPTRLFIKKLPADAAAILAENSDLCEPAYYDSRFNMQTSKYVTQLQREKLVAMGIVP